MSDWRYRLTPMAQQDMRGLDGSQRKVVYKALQKLVVNPLPKSEGGYGAPLGNRADSKLAGFLKVKLRGSGLRIVYDLVRKDETAYVVVVGVREDSKVYADAQRRLPRYLSWRKDNAET